MTVEKAMPQQAPWPPASPSPSPGPTSETETDHSGEDGDADDDDDDDDDDEDEPVIVFRRRSSKSNKRPFPRLLDSSPAHVLKPTTVNSEFALTTPKQNRTRMMEPLPPTESTTTSADEASHAGNVDQTPNPAPARPSSTPKGDIVVRDGESCRSPIVCSGS